MTDAPQNNSLNGSGPAGDAKAGGQDRRLCAIMFTDIKGFSSLMESDEITAVGLVKAQREIIRRCIARHGGEERETIGDAFLVLFASAVNAVRCGMDIQRDIWDYNQSRDPEKQVWVRIGIHLGDILIEEGSVFGEGVNLAARVEPLAEPGGICITRQVYDQVKHHLRISVARLGVRELKNITDVPDIYRIMISTAAPRGPATFRETLAWFAESRARVAGAAAAFLIVGAASVYWNLFAPHMSFAREVAFRHHAPEPRWTIARSKAHSLNRYYEFTRRGWRIVKLVEVAKPDLLPEDAQQIWEFGPARKQRRTFPTREYVYEDGRVKEELFYDKHGVMQFKLVFSEGGRVATAHDQRGYVKAFENQIAGFGFELDERGHVVRLENRNAFGMRRSDGDGVAAYGYSYGLDDLPVETSAFDVNGNPIENRNGIAVTAMEYGKDGTLVKETYMDRYRAVRESLKGIASVEREYDGDGRLVIERYRDRVGEQTADNDGTCARRFSCDGEGRLTRATTLSCGGSPVATKAGFASTVFEYEGGKLAKKLFLDEQGLPTANNRGVASISIGYDESGRIRSTEFYNPDGSGAVDSDRAHAIRYSYDGMGRPSRRTYLGLDSKPAIAGMGYAEVAVQYNDRGDATEWTYFDPEGKPTNTWDGYSVVRNEYDQAGNLVSKSFFDRAGDPAIGRDDACHRIQKKYDEKGNLVENRCLDGQGRLSPGIANCAISSYQYDAYGKLVRFECYVDEVKLIDSPNLPSILTIKYDRRGYTSEVNAFDASGAPAERYQGAAVWRVTSDEFGNQVEISTYDRNGNLIDNPKYKAAIFRREFDSKGHELKAQVFNREGLAAIGIWGFSEIRYAYDALGHRTREAYYDERGEPTSDWQGVHEHRTSYDERGRVIEMANVGRDGAPAQNSDGVAFTRYAYDALGFLTKIEYEGTDRGPAINRRFGCAAQEFKVDDRGNVVEIRRMDEAGGPCDEPGCVAVTIQSFDAKGRMVKQLFQDGRGQPAPDETGAYGFDFEYDISGKVLAKDVVGPDGSGGRDGDGVHRFIHHYRPDTGRLWYITFAGEGGEGAKTSAGADLRLVLYDPVYLERQRARADVAAGGRIVSVRCLDAAGNATGETACASPAEIAAEAAKIKER